MDEILQAPREIGNNSGGSGYRFFGLRFNVKIRGTIQKEKLCRSAN
jgi:hypothetical protein